MPGGLPAMITTRSPSLTRPIWSSWSEGSTQPTVGFVAPATEYTGTDNFRYQFKVSSLSDMDSDGVADAYHVTWKNQDGTDGEADISMTAGGTINTAENIQLDFGAGATSLQPGD